MEPLSFSVNKDWILTGKDILSTEDLLRMFQSHAGKEFPWKIVEEPTNELFSLLLATSDIDIPNQTIQKILNKEPIILLDWFKKNTLNFL